jgi:hypothetical protein
MATPKGIAMGPAVDRARFTTVRHFVQPDARPGVGGISRSGGTMRTRVWCTSSLVLASLALAYGMLNFIGMVTLAKYFERKQEQP